MDPDIDKYTQHKLEKCLKNKFSYIVPLTTVGDGNCLVHSISMQKNGIDDINYMERQKLHEYFLQCSPEFKERWKYQETIWHEEDGFALNDAEWTQEWETMVYLASAEVSTSPNKLPLRSLEMIHIFALANMNKRPIIVIAKKRHHTNTKQRYAGVYLPILHEPNECNREPMIIAYNEGHFNAMSATVSNKEDMIWPLTGNLLALPYSDCSKGGMTSTQKADLLQKYLNTEVKKTRKNKTVLCVRYGLLIPEVDSHETTAQISDCGGTNVDSVQQETSASVSSIGKARTNNKKNASGDSLFCCQKCGITFSTKGNFVSHNRLKHDPNAKNVKCKMCNQVYTLKKKPNCSLPQASFRWFRSNQEQRRNKKKNSTVDRRFEILFVFHLEICKTFRSLSVFPISKR